MAETALAIAAVSSAAIAAGTSVMGAQTARAAGSAQRRQAEVQAQGLAEQQRQVRERAQQEEAERVLAMNRVLSTQAAIRGAAGLAPDTPGGQTLMLETEQTTKRDIDTIRVNAEREARSLGLAGERALLSGQAAETQARGQAMAAYGQAAQALTSAGRSGYNYLSGRGL